MRFSRRQMMVALGATAIPANLSAISPSRRVLVDRSLPGVTQLLPQGARVIARTGDPVRQLQALLAQSQQPITGLTSGADALVARGLARELRRKFALFDQQGALLHWTIGRKEIP